MADAASGQSFVPFNFAISLDGKRLAFVSIRPDGKAALWVRTMNTTGAQEISGSDDAQFPFWAPDSRRLAFLSQRMLQVVDLGSGEKRALAEVPVVIVGGTWNRDDTILYAAGPYSVLYKIPAAGGTTTLVTRVPTERSGQAHRWPVFLPDGKHFLYLATWSSPDDPHGDGLYAASIFRQRCPRLPVSRGLSHSYDLVRRIGPATQRVSETGNRDPRLSPDGSFLATAADEVGKGRTKIRVYDLVRGLSSALTPGSKDEPSDGFGPETWL